MYESHFGLRQRPFRATPDTASYYAATSHERALAQLSRAIDEDEGLVLLIGEPGTGKTTLAHCLMDRLEEKTTSAFLTNSHFRDRSGLLQAILYDLSLPYEGLGEQELRLKLTDFLLKNYETGQRTILLVDEAQHLSPDHLEELRLLGNLEGQQSKAIQTVLIAQPDIAEILSFPALAAFRQRLAVHACLEPLALHEAADYLIHHLRTVGARPEDIVSDEALEVLARGARGIPRLLNRAAHQALSLAFAAGASLVDAEAALEALTLLGLSESEETGPEATESSSSLRQDEEIPQEAEQEADSGSVLGLEGTADANDMSKREPPRDTGRVRPLFASPKRPA